MIYYILYINKIYYILYRMYNIAYILYHILYIIYNILYITYYILYIIYISCNILRFLKDFFLNVYLSIAQKQTNIIDFSTRTC